MANVEWNLNGKGPLWQQIADILRRSIATGVYPAGSRLPTVRDLASQAAVNPNTMQRAMSQLEADGIAVANSTSGRTVTDNENIIAELRMSMARERTENYLAEMQILGFTPSEVVQLIREEN